MELGGAEMALLGLLNALDPERIDADLFIYSHQGPLMKYIPEWVNLLPEVPAYSMLEQPIADVLRRGQFGVAIGRMAARIRHKIYGESTPTQLDDEALITYVADSILPYLPKINPSIEYDLCISFLIPHIIGLKKVKAKKRIAWIHTDYSTVSLNTEMELPIWGAYDKISSISKEVTNSFISSFPSLESKIIEIENILPAQYIIKRAEEASVTLDGKINLLSIGRFCYAKNYDNVPYIARRMVEAGCADFKWYIIGYGGDEALIRQKIAEAGMEEHVVLLGKKENPYPYIKACDIYVQPSRYEGKSITVREAQMLGKPVVVTAYPTASSQINDCIDGAIVPLENQGCAEGLINFIADKELQNRIIANLNSADISGANEVEKIYELLT